MVPDRDQASDAVQEAFFSAYRNMKSFRGGSVRSWLSRIAINAAMDQQRLKKRRPTQPYPELEDESWQPPAGHEADPVRTAMQGERTRVLNAALASITPDQRQAIVLFDVEGYDYAEIAELTGVSLGTVSTLVSSSPAMPRVASPPPRGPGNANLGPASGARSRRQPDGRSEAACSGVRVKSRVRTGAGSSAVAALIARRSAWRAAQSAHEATRSVASWSSVPVASSAA
jgi:RNA polymerase sigma-70 factor (ECF subfamily)